MLFPSVRPLNPFSFAIVAGFACGLGELSILRFALRIAPPMSAAKPRAYRVRVGTLHEINDGDRGCSIVGNRCNWGSLRELGTRRR